MVGFCAINSLEELSNEPEAPQETLSKLLRWVRRGADACDHCRLAIQSGRSDAVYGGENATASAAALMVWVRLRSKRELKELADCGFFQHDRSRKPPKSCEGRRLLAAPGGGLESLPARCAAGA